jgi:phage shock protein E
MTRKLILLSVILLLLSILSILMLSAGCKAADAYQDEISSRSEESTIIEETEEVEKTVDTVPEEEEPQEVEEPQEEDIEVTEIMPISPKEVFEIIENGEDYLIVDVRTQEEYDTGHLEGAILLPVQELEDRLDELPKDKRIIVYCRSGNRSRTAAGILIDNGFSQIYDMGGIGDWIEEGYPVET